MTKSQSGRLTAVLSYRHLETPAVPIVVTERGEEFELVELLGCDVDFDGMWKSRVRVTVRSRWVSTPPYADCLQIDLSPVCKGRNVGIKAAITCGCFVGFFVLIVVLCLLGKI